MSTVSGIGSNNQASTTQNNQSSTNSSDATKKAEDSKELKFFDISEKARAEREQQKALEELETNKNKRKGVDKDAFMKLFIAQLKHQDPMEPLKNEQFITQMSQLSSVEQLSNLNAQFTKFAQKFDSFDSLSALNTNLEKLSKNLDFENSEAGINKFIASYGNNNKDILDVLKNIQVEITKLSTQKDEEYKKNNQLLLDRIDSLENEIRILREG